MWGHIFDIENPLIGVDNTWMLWGIVAFCVALSIYLEQKFAWASKMSGAILALIFALVLSNLGIIPTDAPVWDTVWGYVVPLAIPLLLLQCDIRKIGKSSGRMLIIFLIGSVGTMVGTTLGYLALKGLIPDLNEIAGMITGSYIGGGVNFAALSLAFNTPKNMVAATTVADNLNMAVYFFVLIAIPTVAFFRKHYRHPHVDEVEARPLGEGNATAAASYWGAKEISLKDLAMNGATSFVIVAASNVISTVLGNMIPDTGGFHLLNLFLSNLYLWITTITMICATVKPSFFGEIRGSQEIGTYLIYFFFFVIGVPASISLILRNSPLLLVFCLIVVIINMAVTFLFGRLFNFSLEEIILASNANIGGPTTAAAMAVSKGWTKLIGPTLLVGTLGYVIGTYAGLLLGGLFGA